MYGLLRSVVAASIGLSLAATCAAAAEPGSRQAVSFLFDEGRPGHASGLRLGIDYVNPADAAAKPYAVQTVVETLAPGSRFDTSVPERCTASNPQLMLEGARACPAGSRVGGGELDFDLGLGVVLHLNATLLNNTGELILLLEPIGAPDVGRTVSRSPIGERSITAEAPPLPGGPPDGYGAIKRVRFTVSRISRSRDGQTRNYLTTPPSCPGAGAWTNTIRFVYRDGVAQSADSSSPCEVTRSRPQIVVRDVPRRCATRSFRARIRIRSGAGLSRVRVRRNERWLRTTTRDRFDARVPVRGLRAGRHRLSVVAFDLAGARVTKTVRFRRC